MTTSQLLPITYALDTTGVSPNNKVTNERITLSAGSIRAAALRHFPFFKDGLIVKDVTNNRTLSSTEFGFYGLHPLASASYGKEIFSILIIKNASVGSVLDVTYQTLGGEYSRSYEVLKTLIDTLIADTRPASWPNIVNKPLTFNATHHLHAVGDTIGFEYLVSAIEQLINVISTSASGRSDSILRYLDQRLGALSGNVTLTANLTTALSNHTSNTSNPHNVTKAQVGLGNVENLNISTKQQIVTANVSSPKFVTNVVLKDYVGDTISAHSNQTQSTLNNLTTSVTSFGSNISVLEATMQNVSLNQTVVSELNAKYSNLTISLNAAISNLETSRVRANTAIQTYLNISS